MKSLDILKQKWVDLSAYGVDLAVVTLPSGAKRMVVDGLAASPHKDLVEQSFLSLGYGYSNSGFLVSKSTKISPSQLFRMLPRGLVREMEISRVQMDLSRLLSREDWHSSPDRISESDLDPPYQPEPEAEDVPAARISVSFPGYEPDGLSPVPLPAAAIDAVVMHATSSPRSKRHLTRRLAAKKWMSRRQQVSFTDFIKLAGRALDVSSAMDLRRMLQQEVETRLEKVDLPSGFDAVTDPFERAVLKWIRRDPSLSWSDVEWKMREAGAQFRPGRVLNIFRAYGFHRMRSRLSFASDNEATPESVRAWTPARHVRQTIRNPAKVMIRDPAKITLDRVLLQTTLDPEAGSEQTAIAVNNWGENVTASDVEAIWKEKGLETPTRRFNYSETWGRVRPGTTKAGRHRKELVFKSRDQATS